MTDNSYSQAQQKVASYLLKDSRRKLQRALTFFDEGHTDMFQAVIRNVAEDEAAARACYKRSEGSFDEARYQVPGVVERSEREKKYYTLKKLAQNGWDPILHGMVAEIDRYEEENGFD